MSKAKSLILAGLLISTTARAEFSFSCGKGREKGPEQAEVGFVDSLDSLLKLFLKGKEVPEKTVAFKATENDMWIAEIDLGPGKGTRRFEFSIGNSSVQEFAVSDSGKDRKIGQVKKCDYKRMQPDTEKAQ